MSATGSTARNAWLTTLTIGTLFVVPGMASLLLMRAAGAGPGAQLIQALALVLAIGAVVTSHALARHGQGHGRTPTASRQVRWLVWALVGLLLLPVGLPHTDASPHRWLVLGSLRVYVPPLVLPSLLLLGASSRPVGPDHATLGALMVTALILALMPDAPQAIAWSLGVLALLVTQRSTGRPQQVVSQRLGLPIALVASALCAGWASSQPDPLPPVDFVEGVFALGFAQSMLVGGAIVACAVGLVATLCGHALRTLPALWPVATYFAALYVQAAVFQSTPAPVLGFGASPILGLALAIAVADWLGRFAPLDP